MSLTSYRAAPPRVDPAHALALRSSEGNFALGRPGSDLLSRALRHSTIGAEGFHGRVRNGIGCTPLATATRSSKRKDWKRSEVPGTYTKPRRGCRPLHGTMKSSRSSY